MPTIDPTQIYFGAPVSLTYGGVDVGGTVDIPKITITPTVYTPKFINARGPIIGTDNVTEVLVAAEFTVNQLTGAKLAWSLPGSVTTGDHTDWTPGRIPSAAYQTLILIGPGLDGRTMIVSIYNAVNIGPLELDFGNTAIAGMKVKMEGRYAADSPTLAPFDIDFAAAGSGS